MFVSIMTTRQEVVNCLESVYYYDYMDEALGIEYADDEEDSNEL